MDLPQDGEGPLFVLNSQSGLPDPWVEKPTTTRRGDVFVMKQHHICKGVRLFILVSGVSNDRVLVAVMLYLTFF